MRNDAGEPAGILERLALIRPDERPAALWSCLYFFCLLAGYFVLRPMREQVGIREGIDILPWLFTATFLSMAVANPVFSALVTRFPRRKFIPYVYRFFALNLVAFYLLFRFIPKEDLKPVNWTFFIWLSVFNLFAVTVFRGFMADIFTQDQGRRLFGLIGIGGTVGALVGASISEQFAKVLGPVNLMLVSLVFLECATQCMLKVSRLRAQDARRDHVPDAGEERVGGTVFSGIVAAVRTPYMLGICAFVLFTSVMFTMFYVEQATIVKATFHDDASQISAFASIDKYTQLLTLVLEVFLTGRILRYFGVRLSLVALPLLSVAAFVALTISPTFGVLAVFQVMLRGTNYGLNSPAREVLFTTMTREEKYKTKSLIDTFVFRSGDLLGIWIKPLVGTLGFGLALVAVPLGSLWAVTGWWLGARQDRLARAAAKTAATADAPPA